MFWVKAKSIAFSSPRWCSVGLHARLPHPTPPWQLCKPVNFSGERKSTKTKSKDGVDEKYNPDIMWWKEVKKLNHLDEKAKFGAIPTKLTQHLLDSLVTRNCTGPPALYIKDLLLNPPPYATASTIQSICKLMSNVQWPNTQLTCISPLKLVKSLELKEASDVDFGKLKSVVDEILQLYRKPELNKILRLLMEPTLVATGLNIEFQTLVNECESTSHRIGELLDASSNKQVGSKGRKVKEELSGELQAKTDVLIFASMLLVIAQALFAHVSEGYRRKWAFPTLVQFQDFKEKGQMKITGLLPFNYDPAKGNVVQANTIDMKKLFLLTGPVTGGKTILIHSVHATVLFGLCGFMVPAESAIIPQFDSIFLHFADAKKTSEMQESELLSIAKRASPKSLVLVDDICYKMDPETGTCFAGYILKKLDSIGCLGIISTNLMDMFKLPVTVYNTVFKAMGIEYEDGKKKASYKMIDGVSRESLLFELAERVGWPKSVIQRARERYEENKSSWKCNIKTKGSNTTEEV